MQTSDHAAHRVSAEPTTDHATGNTAAASSRAGRSAARRFAVEHPVAAYLILSFGIAWPLLFTLVLLRQPVEPGLLVLVFLGQTGPAVLVTAAQGGRPAVRELLSRTLRWRVHPGWYVLAVFALPVLMLLAATVARGAAPAQALLQDPGIVTAYLAALLIVPVINLWEETGWMFVQARLERTRGVVRGGAITGLLFAALHAPLYLDLDSARDTAVASLLSLAIAPSFRIVAGWIYRHARSCVLIVALFHGAFNAGNTATFSGALFPGVEPGIAVGAAVILLGTGVVWASRAR